MIPCNLCLLSLSSLTSFLVGQGDLTLLPTILATLGGRQASILVAAAKVPGKALIGSDGSRPLSWDQAGAWEALVGQAGLWVSLFSNMRASHGGKWHQVRACVECPFGHPVQRLCHAFVDPCCFPCYWWCHKDPECLFKSCSCFLQVHRVAVRQGYVLSSGHGL